MSGSVLLTQPAACSAGKVPPARRPEVRYPTHIPLSPVQKGAVGLFSLLGAFSDPRRGDLVAAAGETTGLVPLRVGLPRGPTRFRVTYLCMGCL